MWRFQDDSLSFCLSFSSPYLSPLLLFPLSSLSCSSFLLVYFRPFFCHYFQLIHFNNYINLFVFPVNYHCRSTALFWNLQETTTTRFFLLRSLFSLQMPSRANFMSPASQAMDNIHPLWRTTCNHLPLVPDSEGHTTSKTSAWKHRYYRLVFCFCLFASHRQGQAP